MNLGITVQEGMSLEAVAELTRLLENTRKFIDDDLRTNTEMLIKKGHKLKNIIVIYVVKCEPSNWIYELLKLPKSAGEVGGYFVEFDPGILEDISNTYSPKFAKKILALGEKTEGLRVMIFIGRMVQIMVKEYSYFIDQSSN